MRKDRMPLAPIPRESAIGSDLMKPIAAPIGRRNHHLSNSDPHMRVGILRDHELTSATTGSMRNRRNAARRVVGKVYCVRPFID